MDTSRRVLLGTDSAESPLQAARAVGRCSIRTLSLLARRRLHQPRDQVGRVVCFSDGTSGEVYRETRVDHGPVGAPAVLVVGFRLRLVRRPWGHALFRRESLLNTVLFAGFDGLVSKLWLRHDRDGVYRGLYEWDGAELALNYVNALWWVLAAVSVRGSIWYAVLPGVTRAQVLADPTVLDGIAEGREAWWRPVAVQPSSGPLSGPGPVPGPWSLVEAAPGRHHRQG